MIILKRIFLKAVLFAAAPACMFLIGISLQAAEEISWPIFRGDRSLSGRTSGRLPEKLKLLWSFKTDDEIKSSPVIGAGRVFIGSMDGKVYALTLSEGKKIWEFDTESAVEAPPLLVQNSVYIGSLDGVFFAIDAASGKLKWKYETGNRISGSANWIPAVKGKGTWILVGSYDNVLHAVDSETGKKIWTYQTENYINGSPAISADDSIDGGPVIVFGGCDMRIHVVSARKGLKIATIDTESYIAASAAIADDQVFVGNYAGQLIRIDLTKREKVWEFWNEETGAPFFFIPCDREEQYYSRVKGRYALQC